LSSSSSASRFKPPKLKVGEAGEFLPLPPIFGVPTETGAILRSPEIIYEFVFPRERCPSLIPIGELFMLISGDVVKLLSYSYLNVPLKF